MKITENDVMIVMSAADAIIKEQKNYIRELENQVDDLQKALDTLLLNKCRVRKVKVKVYGRSPVDKNLHRYVRQAED